VIIKDRQHSFHISFLTEEMVDVPHVKAGLVFQVEELLKELLIQVKVSRRQESMTEN